VATFDGPGEEARGRFTWCRLFAGATRKNEPYITKAVLMISTALAAGGAIAGGYAMANADGYGSEFKK
jgi:hypothetical protein